MLMILLKGIAIGLVVGAPIGVVGALMMQRTLAHGFWAGMLTGLGSSLVDCLFAVAGAFGLGMISGFMMHHKFWFHLISGILVLSFAVVLFFKKNETAKQKETVGSYGVMFLSSILVGITDPTCILTFCIAFSVLGIQCPMPFNEGTVMVSGVLIGTLLWWILVSSITMKLRAKALLHLKTINRCFGTFLVLISIVILAGCFQ